MKRNTFSVLCYARKREQGKDRQYPIMVRITIDSEQVQFNSQLMVDKKMWKDGGVVGRSATAVHLRTQIEKIKTDITRIYEREIENNRYPSPLKLKNIYLGIETKSNTLLTVEHLQEIRPDLPEAGRVYSVQVQEREVQGYPFDRNKRGIH